MDDPTDADVAELDPESAGLLVPLVYEELRRIARRERYRLSGGETLSTTALVNEAFLKLAHSGFGSRGHFLRYAAVAMRNILVDRARSQLAAKRGGGAIHVALEEAQDFVVEDDAHLIQVHEALARLSEHNPRLARIAECRFFAGYDEVETGEALGLSRRTVQRDWTLARAWLMRELQMG